MTSFYDELRRQEHQAELERAHLSPETRLGRVMEMLRHVRLEAASDHYAIRRAIAGSLSQHGHAYRSPKSLGARCRIDVLTLTGVAITIQKGEPAPAELGQVVEDCCVVHAVDALVLVLDRRAPQIDRAGNGKPVRQLCGARAGRRT